VDLTALLQPSDIELFVRDYWEQRPFVVSDRDPGLYKGIFSLAHADQILSAPSLFAPMIRIIDEGRAVPFDRAALDGATVDVSAVEALLARYRQGATLAFNGLERAFPPLRSLCASLGRQVSARFGVNAYLTPPSAQGFGTHCDTHDVFVLQIEGVKHWSVFDAEVRLPLRETPRSVGGSHEPLLDRDLRPGDLLYIPRGFPHHAVSDKATSLHLTIGAHPPTWATLLRTAVEDSIDHDDRLRTALPFGFAVNDSARKDALAIFRDLLDRFVGGVNLEALVADAADSVLLAQLPALAGRLSDIESESRISETTRVKRRTEVEYQMGIKGDQIRLEFNGKIVSIPATAEAELHHLLEAEKCTALELPGNIDSGGRVLLIKRLVREGILTMEELDGW
jgi:hypothetical protein